MPSEYYLNTTDIWKVFILAAHEKDSEGSCFSWVLF